MTIKEAQPRIRQFKYRQEKGDPDYGMCMWAHFNLDTENYTLTIESDCGDYSYGWTPTPNSESFEHLMSRVNDSYLLEKIADRDVFDYEESKKQTIENIKEYFFGDEETISAILDEIEFHECMGDIYSDYHEFYRIIERYLEEHNCCDIFETIAVEMDYNAGAKRIVKIFCEVLQPILKKECEDRP